MRKNLLCATLVGFVAGCGGGGGAASSPDAQVVVDDANAQETAVETTSYCTSKSALTSVTDLSGTWVARMSEAQVVNAKFVGVMHTQNILYLLLTIAQDGTSLVADGRYCDRKIVNPSKTSNLASVVIPDAWAHAETPVHRSGSFSVGPDGTPIFALSRYTEIIGANLVNPENDVLPTTIDDLRLVDQDGDTIPGITVVISGVMSGSLYSVQRQISSVSAIPVTTDRVEGALTFTSEQNVLGSDPPTLAGIYAAGSTTTDPEPCNSGFVMVKITNATTLDGGTAMDGGASVDGGSVGCEWVRANEAVLFP
jgi:hypothetical protein